MIKHHLTAFPFVIKEEEIYKLDNNPVVKLSQPGYDIELHIL